MKNKKIEFIRAVRLLAPQDKLVLQFAACVREEDLPNYPGAAALELVAALHRITGAASCPRRLRRSPLTPGATNPPVAPPSLRHHSSPPLPRFAPRKPGGATL